MTYDHLAGLGKRTVEMSDKLQADVGGLDRALGLGTGRVTG